jgi:two-component system response regulator CpxR
VIAVAAAHPESLRILLVDDDRELCRLMDEFLSSHGFEVATAYDGPSAVRAALAETFDVITLDVMLPEFDGFEVLRQVRRRSTVPVIMLTARTAPEDRISGLDSGADDYLPKPFHPGELLARIRAVLRRAAAPGAAATDVIEIGEVRLSAGEREAWARGTPLALTTAEFDILELLMRRAGLAVSRDEIATALYQRPASPLERTVDVHVSNLRRKLQASGVDCIRTIRAVGYLFARS